VEFLKLRRWEGEKIRRCLMKDGLLEKNSYSFDKVLLAKNRFLHIYFNERTGTTAFALVEKERRIWGIYYDNLRGWHEHTIENPESHQSIQLADVQETIKPSRSMATVTVAHWLL